MKVSRGLYVGLIVEESDVHLKERDLSLLESTKKTRRPPLQERGEDVPSRVKVKMKKGSRREGEACCRHDTLMSPVDTVRGVTPLNPGTPTLPRARPTTRRYLPDTGLSS